MLSIPVRYVTSTRHGPPASGGRACPIDGALQSPGPISLVDCTHINARYTAIRAFQYFYECSVINVIEACVLAIDAVCTGLLATAALRWEGTDRGSHVNTAVIVLQMISLCGELMSQLAYNCLLLTAICSSYSGSTYQHRILRPDRCCIC